MMYIPFYCLMKLSRPLAYYSKKKNNLYYGYSP
jgi:hypothetical protein